MYNDRRIWGWSKRFKKYIELNKKKLKLLREQERNEIKKWNKKKVRYVR